MTKNTSTPMYRPPIPGLLSALAQTSGFQSIAGVLGLRCRAAEPRMRGCRLSCAGRVPEVKGLDPQ